jgi:hypothetical protein
MTLPEQTVLDAIRSKSLTKILRGEVYVFATPVRVNDDMRPTDHVEFLERGLYPLVRELGANEIQTQLDSSLREVCSDALGVFCAHQCFYVELVKEREGTSPISLDRESLPKFLASKFVEQASALHALEVRPGDLTNDRSYKTVVSGMRILARDYGVDWGVEIPPR